MCKRERVYVTEIGREQRREGETVKEKKKIESKKDEMNFVLSIFGYFSLA